MKKHITILTTILLAAKLFGAPDVLNLAEKSINSFDTKLYQSLCKTQGNVNYSAISIYSLLYVLQKGADGTTKEQINSVIELEPDLEADLQLKDIITGTQNMTNSFWYKNTLKIQGDYNQFIRDYNFELKSTDFYQTQKVRKEINDYISQKTDKLIENFLQDVLPAATKLVLLNTLYFNQKWKNEFDEEATRNQTFYKTKENKIQVPMMNKTSNMQYYQDNNFQIVELAYKDERYSMIVILPIDYEYDFSKLNPAELVQQFNESKARQRIQLSFPKFDITSRYDLIPVLEALGMHDAFNPETSNLSNIFTNSENLYVDAAIHQVRIQVNEKETKAAAVTMFGMKATSAMPQPTIPFTADHPFVYVIRDNETGIDLFTGIVREPK